MSDVNNAQPETKPEAGSAADFAQLDEGEVRLPPNNPNKPEARQESSGDDEPVAAAAGEGEPETDEPDPYAEPPEFWSKERKELYARVTDPEVRQAIHEQEKERVAATSKKLEEAANERKTSIEKAQQLESERDQLANWWKDTGPKLAAAFRSRWENVNWDQLAADNPAEWARQKQEFENHSNLIRGAAEKHEGELRAASQRAAQSLQRAKRDAHEEVAKKYPDHFGKPEVAQKTYDEIRDYLMEQGVPADRIPNIYEPFVVGTALKAMLYDKAQAAAAKAKANPMQPTTATQTPRRIAPGATSRGQPNTSNADRQALERLNNGETLSREDAGRLFA
jgi:hypothetical protein